MYNIAATYPPLIVIERIMQYASYIPETQEPYKWKTKLSLLAVCHMWRKHALRWIYRYSFYVDVNGTTDKMVNTNIPLLLNNYLTSHTQNILIRLANLKCLAVFLEEYESVFNFEKDSWFHITKLDFIINDRAAIPDSFLKDVSPDEKVCRFTAFFKDVVQYMPKITHLNLQYKDDTSVSQSANTLLFNAYSNQLASFIGIHVSSFKPTQCFENLTVLNVKFNPETEHLLPTIDCTKLEKLYLSEIPFKFSWKYFCKDITSSKHVNFKSLDTLTLNYMENPVDFDMFLPDDNENENENSLAGIEQFKVYFPKIKSVNILNAVGEPILRSKYVFPNHINNVTMLNSFKILNSLEKSGLEDVNTVSLIFSSIESEEEDGFYQYTNWLFGLNSSHKSGSLTLYSCSFKLDWEKIRWINLTTLYLSKCDTWTLATILYYNSRLKSLNLCELVLDGVSDSPYFIASDNVGNASFRTMKPNKNLNSVEIRKIDNIDNTFDHAVILLQTLIGIFQNLKQVSVCKQIVKPLEQYVQKYKHNYPHFETLKVHSALLLF